MAGQATPATRALSKARVSHELHPYHHDPESTHFGDEAVEALGLDPLQVFKTLVVSCTGGPQSVAVAVVPVACQLDLKAMAAAMGAKKAALADPQAAERATGYVVGGISPLGQKRRLPVVIDASAETQQTVFVSAGRRGLQLELSPIDLARLCGGSFAPVAR